MPRTRLMILCAVCVFAALPGAAPRLAAPPAQAGSAKLPRFTHPARFASKRIVEGVSIGGVSLGMSKAKAISVWGKPDGICRRGNPYDPNDRRRDCTYGGFIQTRKGKTSTQGYADFTVTPAGVVTSVGVLLINWGINDAHLRRDYALAAERVRPLRTGKGIRLESEMDAARRAYGLPIPVEGPSGPDADVQGEVILTGPDACTVFSSRDSKPTFKNIESISVVTAAYCPQQKDPGSTGGGR